jgi:succinoglycan biosynthesis protein ExoA
MNALNLPSNSIHAHDAQTEGPPGPGLQPWVSVMVPCRNERGHIDAFLDGLQNQQGFEGIEILVADGMSNDGTRERLLARMSELPALRLLDNPGRIVSTGLNAALEQARSEWVVRMDVHTSYAPDYLQRCVEVLQVTGATCVGGAWLPRAQGWPQDAIAQAFESRFGSGGASSRQASLEGWVDTVYLGAWRRAELLRLGGFDENLVRNQDDELNLRIHREGGRVWQSPLIRSWYTPRGSFSALFRQFFQYGYWKLAVIRKHRLPASVRHLVPFAFVALLGGLALAGLVWPVAAWACLGLLATYAAAALGVAARLAPPWRQPRLCLGVAWAFVCMHLGYGWGFGLALADAVRKPRHLSDRSTELTR